MKVKHRKAQFRGSRRMMLAPHDNAMEKLSKELNVPYNPPMPEQDPEPSEELGTLIAGAVTIGTIVLPNLYRVIVG